jgi:Family of unknown function (DUF6603)
MSDEGTLRDVAIGLVLALQPAVDAVETPDALRDFLADLGWSFDAAPAPLLALKPALHTAYDLLIGADDEGSIDLADLLAALGTAFGAIQELASSPDLPASFKTEFPGQVVDDLLVGYLLDNAPIWGEILRAIGMIRVESVSASPGRLPFERRTFDREKLVDFAADPLQTLEETYRWGSSDFRSDEVLQRVTGLALALELPVGDAFPSSRVLGHLNADALRDGDTYNSGTNVILVERGSGPSRVTFGLGFFPVPETATARPGIALLPNATGSVSDPIDLAADTAVTIEGDATVELAVVIRPGQPASLLSGAGLGCSYRFAPGRTTTILGSDTGTRLQLAGAAGTLSIATLDGEVEVVASLDTIDLTLVIASAEADGFSASTLSAREVVVPFPFGLRWSSRTGLALNGGSGLVAEVPLNVALGPVQLEAVRVAARGDHRGGAPRARLEVGALLAGSLGPVELELDGAGLEVALVLAPGNLGPIDLAVGFKAPTGVGLRVDGGLVSGGGFASFDATRGRYAGALELDLLGVSAAAFAIVDTRLPGERRGFSLAAVIAAQFPRVPLGLGFSLDGIGGLLAVNRGIDVDALRAAVRGAGMDDVFFPADPVAHAGRLLGDLAAFFPTASGRHVLGPAAKIGWGTPEVLTSTIALLVEVPSPVRVVLLGQARLGLPELDRPFVDLRVDVLGVVDLARCSLAVDAALHDSKLAGYALTGDMALRLAWGDRPEFLFSVGGFHPHFTPPPGFPTLRRLALTAGDNPQLRMDCYLALTSNTAQVGAHADLTASGGGFDIQAHVGFDALFEFAPFHFEVEIAANASIAWHGHHLLGVGLDFLLTGPHPWHAKGDATFSVLWWDVSVGFDTTWGDATPEPLPAAPDVAKALTDALGRPEAWAGELPAGEPPWVVFDPGGADVTLVHPFAALVVHQRAVPLDYDITQFGNIPLAESRRFAIAKKVKVGATEAVGAPVSDAFAPGQFTRLSADQELSAPSFEPFHSGVRTADGEIRIGADARASMETLTIEDDPLAPPTHAFPPVALPTTIGAVAGVVRPTGRPPAPPRRGPRLRDFAFTLASRARPSGAGAPRTLRIARPYGPTSRSSGARRGSRSCHASRSPTPMPGSSSCARTSTRATSSSSTPSRAAR